MNIINSHACTCRHFSSSLRLPYIRTHSATHTLHTLNGSCSISHVRCAARSLCDFISLSLSVSFGSLIHGALGMLFESCMSVFYMTNAETVFSFVATDVWHCCPLLLVYFLSVFLVVHVIYYIYFFLLLLPVLFLVLLLSLLSSIYSYFFVSFVSSFVRMKQQKFMFVQKRFQSAHKSVWFLFYLSLLQSLH